MSAQPASAAVLLVERRAFQRWFVTALLEQATGELTTAENLNMPDSLRNLYKHLMERGRIRSMELFDRSVLHIFSRDVLRRIKDQDDSWEQMVPAEIATVIKKRRFFGYREKEKV